MKKIFLIFIVSILSFMVAGQTLYWYPNYYGRATTVLATGLPKGVQLDSLVGGIWNTAGNANTNPTHNFIGTTDGEPFIFKTNLIECMRIIPGGNVGIGTPTPAYPLEVAGVIQADRNLLTGVPGGPPGRVVIYAGGSTNYYSSFNSAPTGMTGNALYVLPTGIASSSGQVLSSDMSGNLSWTSGGIYNGTSPTNVTVGALAAGTAIAGLTFTQIIQDMTNTYLYPAFSSFYISGQAISIEVGTTISGTKTFDWSITNGTNVMANTNYIYDLTGTDTLSSGLANSGTTTDAVGTINLSSPGSYVWQGGAKNSLDIFFKSNYTVTWLYYIFWGPSASAVTTSAEVRALGSSEFTSGSNPFILNTGSTDDIFVVAMPATMTITQVLDLDALSANITANYILSTFNVLDAGGNSVSYHVYTMTNSVPYSANHRHQITHS